MSMKFMITTAAVLAVLAGPALAGDHDLATELRDRSWSAVNPARVQAWRGALATPANDFQLQGR